MFCIRRYTYLKSRLFISGDKAKVRGVAERIGKLTEGGRR